MWIVGSVVMWLIVGVPSACIGIRRGSCTRIALAWSRVLSCGSASPVGYWMGMAMPSSQNRRRVELPAELYARLEERAERNGSTVAAATAELIEDGFTMQEWFGKIASDLHDIRRLVLHLSESPGPKTP